MLFHKSVFKVFTNHKTESY